MSLSAKQRVEQIVEHALCTGCGICQAVAGEGLIQVQKGHGIRGKVVPCL
jgi:Pyruvate/2-oxoacid:ferredoxin oxidoreductase delta subunit